MRFGLGLALALVAALASGCATGAALRQAPALTANDAPDLAAEIHARDYKLPLRSDHAADPVALASDVWAAAGPLAQQLGASITKPKKKPKPAKEEVVILDTPDASFRRNGLVLRRRGRAAVPGGQMTQEITLKSRLPDIREAHAAPVEASATVPSALEFKEEILIDPGKPGGARSMWSLESKVRKTALANHLTVADVAEVFPGIVPTLGAPTAPVAPVAAVRIEQIEIELPLLTFGETPVRSSLVVWRDRDDRSVIAAEYVFSEKILDYWTQPAADAAAIRNYFVALQTALATRVGAPPTKTAALYERAGGVGTRLSATP